MALHSLYVKSGDGFLLVFALNAPDSLHELEALHQSIIRIKTTEGLMVDKVPLVYASPFTVLRWSAGPVS